MLRKNDLARIISDRFGLRGGKRIPIYLADWMIDYVFEAIKIALIEDDAVAVKNYAMFRRIDVPEHERRLPNGTVAIIPQRSKVRVEFKPSFLIDLANEEIKEFDHGNKKRV